VAARADVVLHRAPEPAALVVGSNTVSTPTVLPISTRNYVPQRRLSSARRLRERKIVNARTATWALYVVGSLLVFGWWVRLVPPGLGWIGWLMAFAGWFIGNARDGDSQPQLSLAEQIEKLDLLRQKRIITDEEFQKEKSRLLDEARRP
jgi:hypothetical protein